MYAHHICDDKCRILALTDAHERARRAHRARVANALRGRRPRLRTIHANGGQ